VNAGARREDLLEPQRAQRAQRKMKMAHTRTNLGIPSVSSVSFVVHKNPFLLGKDPQIRSIENTENLLRILYASHQTM
jgi:hypothetical protein